MWIRKATEADKDSIVKIWRDNSAMLGGVYVGAIKDAILKNEVHVAEFLGDILGFVHYHTRRDNISTIYHIAVKRAYNGLGVASQLLWSVPCPIRLKVTADNERAIKFYEHNHMIRIEESEASTGRKLYTYYLHTLFIQCAGNNKKFPEICRQAGIPYGSRHDDKVKGELYMLDINWQKYDWQEYLSIVKEYHPTLAMVADYEHPEQKETMLGQVQDLRDLGVLHIMVCPKFDGAIQDIPQDCRIAVSIPSRYAGFLPNPIELKGWRLHFLGGSPNKQRDYFLRYQGHGAIVSSLDGNSHEAASSNMSLWRDGQWQRPPVKREKSDKYAVMQESARNIAKMFQYIGTVKQMSLF